MFIFNYANLTLPQLEKKLVSLEKVASEPIYIGAIIFCLILFLFSISYIASLDEGEKEYRLYLQSGIVTLVISLAGIGGSYMAGHNVYKDSIEVKNLIEEKRLEIAETGLSKIRNSLGEEIQSVEIKDIILSQKVNDNYCPILSNVEKCYFLEFLSAEEITQSFVPIKDNEFKNVGNSFTLNYFVLDQKDKDFFNKFHELDTLRTITGSTIKPESLVIGESFSK